MPSKNDSAKKKQRRQDRKVKLEKELYELLEKKKIK